MPAGQYRERITIQSFTESTADTGNKVKVWRDQSVRIAAAVEMLGGSEDQEHRQQAAEQKFQIKIRYSRELSQVTSLQRIVWETRIINIGNVRWDTKRTEITIDGMQEKAGES